MEDATLEETAGGALRASGGCDICGADEYTEAYYITLKFKDENEYLGKKRVCMKCRDSHLSAYIRANYSGRTLKTLTMEGPF